MARRLIEGLVLVSLMGCPEAPRPSGLDLARDGGVQATDLSDGGAGPGPDAGTAPDAGSGPDTGPSLDGGGLSDGGSDPGPMLRTVDRVDLLSPRAIRNLVLLPDFETNVVNGGWLALPLTPRFTVPAFRRRQHWDAPGPRTDVAILPGETGLYGFAASTSRPVRGEVWIGLLNPGEEDWDFVVAGLIGFVEGMGPSIVFFSEEEEVVVGNRRWRRYGGQSGLALQGRVTFGVQNTGPSDLWVNAPHLEAGPEGARLANPPVPLERRPDFAPTFDPFANPTGPE